MRKAAAALAKVNDLAVKAAEALGWTVIPPHEELSRQSK
jgi:hypothetical protein